VGGLWRSSSSVTWAEWFSTTAKKKQRHTAEIIDPRNFDLCLRRNLAVLGKFIGLDLDLLQILLKLGGHGDYDLLLSNDVITNPALTTGRCTR
jgi:hypothetical protein